MSRVVSHDPPRAEHYWVAEFYFIFFQVEISNLDASFEVKAFQTVRLYTHTEDGYIIATPPLWLPHISGSIYFTVSSREGLTFVFFWPSSPASKQTYCSSFTTETNIGNGT